MTKLSKETLDFVERTREEFLKEIRKPVDKNLVEIENKNNGVLCGPVIKLKEKK